jgi:hypothetical protein
MSQYATPETLEEEQMVAVETFPDVENYSLELEGRDCLVTCGAGTSDDKWLFPHFDYFVETPSEPPLIAEEAVMVQEEVETVGVCPIGLVPNSSVLSARVKGGGEPNWLEKTFDFLHLGWARAMKRISTVYKAALKFRHGLHKNQGQPVADCCVCNEQLDQEASRKALFLVTLTASAQAEQALGKLKLQKQCSLHEGV